MCFKRHLRCSCRKLPKFYEAVSVCAVAAKDKGIELAYIVDHAVPLKMEGDPTRIRQVLVNLLSNALKFTHRGRVSVAVTFTSDAMLRIDVNDTGIGMTDDQVSKLFQPFTQADVSTTRKYGGTGLGLAIVKRVVDLMGGQLHVHSQLGVGSTFTLTMKLLALETFSLEKKPHILLLSCCEITRHTVERSLNAQVTCVGSVAEADTYLRASSSDSVYSAVVADLSGDDHDTGVTQALTEFQHRYGVLAVAVCPRRVQHQTTAATDAHLSCRVLVNPILSSDLVALFRSPQPSGSCLPRAVPDTSGRARGRILVAEDHPVNQQVAERLLKKLGYASDIAVNGAECVEMYQKQPEKYAAILMDCMMPVMDGFEATQRIRALSAPLHSVPIIALTGNASTDDRKQCIESGMTAFVTKPIRLEVLSKTLASFTQN